MRRKYVIIAAILSAVLLLSACSRNDERNFAPGPAAPAPTAMAPPGATVPPPPPAAAPDGGFVFFAAGSTTYGGVTAPASPDFSPEPQEQRQRHIIQTGWTQLETEYFDDTIQTLRQIAPSVNGYIESENYRTVARRMFDITLRIPAAYFQDVILQIEALAFVRSSRQSAEDVTDQFYDTAARLATRRIEEDRLLALIEEATYVRDILDLERRLSNTRVHIEMYSTVLTRMADQIAYSTIHVTVFDIADAPIVPIAGPTLGYRIGGAFGDSVNSVVRGFQNFVVWLAGSIIPLVVWGGIIFVGYKVVRKFVRPRLRS